MGCRLGAERNVDEARFAMLRKQSFIAQNVGEARIDAPQNAKIAADQFFAEGYELFLVNGWFFVCQNEEADIVIAD